MSYADDTIRVLTGFEIPDQPVGYTNRRTLVMFDHTMFELTDHAVQAETERVEALGYGEVQVRVHRNWRNVGGYRYEYWGVRI